MPTLNAQFTPHGPLIDVTVSLHTVRANILRAKGERVPTPISSIALIDTGSDFTLVAPAIVTKLGLQFRASVEVSSISGDGNPESRRTYDGDLMLGEHSTKLSLPLVREPSLSSLPFDVVIGRDVLAHCTLYYSEPDEIANLTI